MFYYYMYARSYYECVNAFAYSVIFYLKPYVPANKQNIILDSKIGQVYEKQ